MNSDPLDVRVLFIEDSQHDVELTLRALRKGGIRGDWRRVHDAEALREVLTDFELDILLADFTVPGFGGIEALKIANKLRPNVPFVFVSGTIGEERAIEALREGASDYVLKNNLARLVPVLKRALRETKENAARKKAQRQLATQYAVARTLAEAGAFEEAMPGLFKAICEHEGFVSATLWRADPDATILRCIDVWTKDTPELTEFAAGIRELEIRPNVGLAGRAWESRQPVWVSDVSREGSLPQALLAGQAGLHVGVAFPIAIRGEIKGIMVFFAGSGTARHVPRDRQPNRPVHGASGAAGAYRPP